MEQTEQDLKPAEVSGLAELITGLGPGTAHQRVETPRANGRPDDRPGHLRVHSCRKNLQYLCLRARSDKPRLDPRGWVSGGSSEACREDSMKTTMARGMRTRGCTHQWSSLVRFEDSYTWRSDARDGNCNALDGALAGAVGYSKQRHPPLAHPVCHLQEVTKGTTKGKVTPQAIHYQK